MRDSQQPMMMPAWVGLAPNSHFGILLESRTLTNSGRHGCEIAAADDDAGLGGTGADVQQEAAHVGHDQVVVLRRSQQRLLRLI